MSDDIHAAITSSIADLDGAGDNGDAAAPEPESPSPPETPAAPAAPETPAAPAAPPAAPVPPAEAVTVTPEGEQPKRPGRIPTDRHEKILAGVRTEHEATVAKLRADHEAQLGEARTQLQLLQVAETNPEQFLDALVRADPRYDTLIRQRAGGNGHAPAAPAPPAPPVPDEMPLPDAQMADGSAGYTLEGLKALMAWNATQVEQRVTKQFEPVLKDHRTREAIRGAAERVAVQVEQAQAWDGFTGNEKEIAAALRADRTLTLEGAYRKVVMGKLKADRDTMRAELLAEINGKPLKVTSTTPAGAPPPATSSDDLQSVIRASIANLRESA